MAPALHLSLAEAQDVEDTHDNGGTGRAGQYIRTGGPDGDETQRDTEGCDIVTAAGESSD